DSEAARPTPAVLRAPSAPGLRARLEEPDQLHDVVRRDPPDRSGAVGGMQHAGPSRNSLGWMMSGAAIPTSVPRAAARRNPWRVRPLTLRGARATHRSPTLEKGEELP